MSSISGEVTNVWPTAGPPDVRFFNPATGLVHVAIGEPGLVETIDPRTGHGTRTATGAGAHTTALVAPDQLYVISPAHGGIRSEEHTSELQSHLNLVCRLLLEKKK